jgi:Tol biopolymer transport system component
MSLSAGQRLGPYEITAPLGAGGMGEVFRARDTKLDREVAVKVLPARLAEDEEALARFEREAKSVAALSHPGILAIHDFGREAGTAYAVMELPARVERPARPVDGGGGRLGGGTGRVEVTNDAALDWSPSWAPDGRHLYFSSTRGGTMNLWRVPIDEATGQVLGAPEPVTTPSLWRGNPSLARDGRLAAFASLDWRSTLLRAAFDPAREELVGPPTPVLRSTQAIRDHAVSPDGQWVALSGAGAQEDLLVARIDGSRGGSRSSTPRRGARSGS